MLLSKFRHHKRTKYKLKLLQKIKTWQLKNKNTSFYLTIITYICVITSNLGKLCIFVISQLNKQIQIHRLGNCIIVIIIISSRSIIIMCSACGRSFDLFIKFLSRSPHFIGFFLQCSVPLFSTLNCLSTGFFFFQDMKFPIFHYIIGNFI